MTPADDLPPLPKSSRGSSGYWGWSWDDMRVYALAARAQRDAEIERLRAALSAAQRLQEAYKVAADVGDYPEQIARRDAEIERLQHNLEVSEHHYNEQITRTLEFERRAEAAEALVRELEVKRDVHNYSALKIADLTDERDILRTRVAELEERLMVMCVAQLKQEAVTFHMTADKTTFTKADVEAITALAVAAALKFKPSPDPPAPAPSEERS